MRSTIKTLCVATLLVALSGAAHATELFTIDSNHASVGFSIKHMVVSKVRGSFGDVSGTITYDPEDLSRSGVKVSIKTASVNTNNGDRDAHLRSPDFFDAEKNPEITFTSDTIERRGDGFVAQGKLTMHGVTREVSIPFTLNGPLTDPWGMTRIGIEAEPIVLDRTDFGLTWNKVLETGGVLVGNEVQVFIDLEAVRKAGE